MNPDINNSYSIDLCELEILLLDDIIRQIIPSKLTINQDRIYHSQWYLEISIEVSILKRVFIFEFHPKLCVIGPGIGDKIIDSYGPDIKSNHLIL